MFCCDLVCFVFAAYCHVDSVTILMTSPEIGWIILLIKYKWVIHLLCDKANDEFNTKSFKMLVFKQLDKLYENKFEIT